MGYYTDYTLTASVCTVADNGVVTTSTPIPRITLASLEDEIEKMNVFESSDDIEYGYYANAKWYDWEEDMSLLSKRFPELLFCLHGEGRVAMIFGTPISLRENVSIVRQQSLMMILTQQSFPLGGKLKTPKKVSIVKKRSMNTQKQF